MAHMAYSETGKRIDESRRSSRELLPVAATCAEWVNMRTTGGVAVHVGRDNAFGNPACFTPHNREIALDVAKLGGVRNAETADLRNVAWALKNKSLVGALMHEGAHAEHSTWDFKRMFEATGDNKRLFDIIVALEETRIEKCLDRSWGLRQHERQCLASMALDVVLADFKLADNAYGMSIAAALVLGRIDSGSLNEDDVVDVRKGITEKLGARVVVKLRLLWKEFQALREADHAFYGQAVDVARRWLDVIGVDEDSEEEDLASQSMGTPDDIEGEGEGEGSESSSSSSVEDAIRDAALGHLNKVDEATAKAMMDATRAERDADVTRRRDRDKYHSHGFSPARVDKARIVQRRQPTAAERRAAVGLARSLERLTYVERQRSRTTALVPPGRLRGRAAVARVAERQATGTSDAEVWSGYRRINSDDIALRTSVIVDISGSMGSAEEPMASTTWIIAEAASRIQGHVTEVLMGSKIHGVLRRGQRPEQVTVYDAYDGSEWFRDAALAADAEVDLIDGTGARLLIIASDGYFVISEHSDYADHFMAKCRRAGVAVVWLQFTSSTRTHGYGETVNCIGKSPVQVAEAVGAAIINAIKKVQP